MNSSNLFTNNINYMKLIMRVIKNDFENLQEIKI